MTYFFEFVAGVLLWLVGCVLFIDVLEFTGPWLMVGGVVTFVVTYFIQCSIAARRIK